ncbi:MAG: hypothetical protein AAGC55_17635 [Myxococcota bacterium]
MLASTWGCNREEVVPLNLDIAVADSCTSDLLGEISILSVNIYGSDVSLGFCILAKRCISFDEPLATAEDVEAALTGPESPLLDIDFEGAEFVTVIGHSNGCFSADDYMMYSVGTVAEAERGRLSMNLTCDPDTSGDGASRPCP